MKQKVILITQNPVNLTQLEQQALNILRTNGGELEIGSFMRSIPRYIITGLINKGYVVIERSEEQNQFNLLVQSGIPIFELGDPIEGKIAKKRPR